jgi:outer membrane receptor protein involved in Fe transport
MALIMKNSSALFTESKYNFYDFSAGFFHRIGTKDYFSFTGHYGQDKFRMDNRNINSHNSLDWGNTVASARWSHIFNTALALTNSLSFTRYEFDLAGSQSEYFFSMFSSVEDYTFKSQLSMVSEKHKCSVGGDLTYHAFVPNEFDVKAGSFIADFVEFNRLFAYEGGIYAEDDIKLTDRWSLGTGLRYSFFDQVGPYKEYLKDETALIMDSIVYPPGGSLAFYHNLEPRLSLKYQPDSKSSLKASYMHIAQYIHLATSSSVSLPMDIWLPSSRDIRPQIGDQVSLGYYRKLSGDDYESSVEIYYKNINRQLEFVNGIVNNSISMNLEESVAVGQGRSYGAEFFIRKKTGDTTGWAGYTISRTERQFDRINEGRVYPAKYDRRHDISVSVIHSINDNWNASAVFIYVTGNALTLPVGRYIIQGNIVNEYGEVNSFRMPPYHRLDLSVTRERITRKGNYSSWIFSVYNVYNRANPYYIYFETTGDLEKYQLEVQARMVSLFPVIPSVSWRFKF